MAPSRSSGEGPLIDLAGRIADGLEVDWEAAESTVGTGEFEDVLRQLQVIAKIAAAHRRAADSLAADKRRDTRQRRAPSRRH